MVQQSFYEATRILFVCKENKNNDYSTIRHLRIILVPPCLRSDPSTHMRVLCQQLHVHTLFTFRSKHAYASWYSTKWCKGKAEETNFWSRYFCCFFAHKKYSLSFVKIHWSTDVTWIILTMSLLCSWALIVVGPLPSMQGQKALGFHQKYLYLCSDDERRSYGFGTQGLAIN